jgi:hypothetical protein
MGHYNPHFHLTEVKPITMPWRKPLPNDGPSFLNIPQRNSSSLNSLINESTDEQSKYQYIRRPLTKQKGFINFNQMKKRDNIFINKQNNPHEGRFVSYNSPKNLSNYRLHITLCFMIF